MEYYYCPKGSGTEIKIGLQKLQKLKATSCILILSCDIRDVSNEEFSQILKECNVPVIGGIYPGILLENNKYTEGVLLVALPFKIQTQLIYNVSSPDIDFEHEVAKLHEDSFEFKTLAVFVDGFSKRLNSLIEALFVVFGLEYNYLGGGAGSLSMKQQPCIICNEGILEDCALIAGLDAECGIGVHHGWESIAGPFKVTSARENRIETIDYKPAFEVYKEIINNHSGLKFNAENFFDIAKSYPFGINKLGAEKVVRDPLTHEGNDLICVGEIQEGAFIDVLHGNKQTLTNAAARASAESSINIHKDHIDFVLFIDCISRVLFLGDDFQRELNAVRTQDIPLIGALTIGEIANNKKDYLEFYNKTAVVTSFSNYSY